MEYHIRSAIFFIILYHHQTCSQGAEVKPSASDSPEIYYLRIKSQVYYRFATTRIESQMINKRGSPEAAKFKVYIPKSAFISAFIMNVGDKEYRGYVVAKSDATRMSSEPTLMMDTEKSEQKRTYTATKARDTNTFTVTVDVPARTQVTFNVTYQEVLERRRGRYDHVIYVDPGKPINDLRVEVHLKEALPITDVQVPDIRKDFDTHVPEDSQLKHVAIRQESDSEIFISYRPTMVQQTSLSAIGVSGHFVVRYDINRTQDAGEIQRAGRYFVHFLAPENLPPIHKNIVFLLDVSGSMSGRKLQQLKDAMHSIVGDMNENDKLNIVTFHSYVRRWKYDGLVYAHPGRIKQARGYLSRLKAKRMTNMNAALREGIRYLIKEAKFANTNNVSMVFFLTDGRPTEGVTNVKQILQRTRKSNKGRFIIHALSYGTAADSTFVRQLALQNRGIAREIFDDSDASLQLQNFYHEIAHPLLMNVQIKYGDGGATVKDVTRTKFDAFYKGSEIIVSGKVTGSDIHACVTGESTTKRVEWCMERPKESSWLFNLWSSSTSDPALGAVIQRMWAYLTLKDMIGKYIKEIKSKRKATFKRQIIQMARKYNFVTEMTSMVLTTEDNPSKNHITIYDTDTARASGLPLRGRGWQDTLDNQGRRRRRGKQNRRRWSRPSGKVYQRQNSTSAPTLPPPRPLVDLLSTSRPKALSKIPVFAARTADGSVVCFRWPQNAPGSWYRILKDRGIQVRGLVRQSDGQTYLMGLDIITPSMRLYVSQYAVRVNRRSVRWGESLTDAGVTVTEDKVLLEPFDGVSLEIYRMARDGPMGATLMVVVGETASLTVNRIGLLASPSRWSVVGNTMQIPGQPSRSAPLTGPFTIGVDQVTCYMPTQDIFRLLQEPPAHHIA